MILLRAFTIRKLMNLIFIFTNENISTDVIVRGYCVSPNNLKKSLIGTSGFLQ